MVLGRDNRNRAGAVAAYEPSDVEEAVRHSAIMKRVEPALEKFLIEFRKVSQESCVPKKRGRLFSEVAQEYH